jgi:SAM-dependent methyltransferase
MNANAQDNYASTFGVLYSTYMGRPRLSQLVARVVWGGDMRPFYGSMRAIGEVPESGTVIDCPCGAGPAFRQLSPGDSRRYLAVDLSPSMLRRAKKRASKRALDNVEVTQGDATKLDLPDGFADLFLSYWGLHCFEQPDLAIGEAARTLKPGGRLLGTCFVRGTGGRADRLLEPGRSDLGRLVTEPEVERWIRDAGFEVEEIERSGPMLLFDARKLGSASSTIGA